MFPKKSAFGQHEDAMNQAAGIVPLGDFPHTASGAEDSRRPGGIEPLRYVSIPKDVYDEWIEQLEVLSDMRGGEQLSYLADQMRSHLPG